MHGYKQENNLKCWLDLDICTQPNVAVVEVLGAILQTKLGGFCLLVWSGERMGKESQIRQLDLQRQDVDVSSCFNAVETQKKNPTLCPADMNSFAISPHIQTPPDKVFGHPKTIPKTPSLGGILMSRVCMYVYLRILVRTMKFGQGTYGCFQK